MLAFLFYESTDELQSTTARRPSRKHERRIRCARDLRTHARTRVRVRTCTTHTYVRTYVLRSEVAQDSEERPPWDGSLNATMLSRVWVERAGSESAVFGGARPLSDLVDMPIDTVYMSMDMPCHATLCYACACSPLSLPLHFAPPFPTLSFFLSLRLVSPSSYVASLFFHLAHLSSRYSWLLCPLFFSFPRNPPSPPPSLSSLSPSLFRPNGLVSLLSLSLLHPLPSFARSVSLAPTAPLCRADGGEEVLGVYVCW